MSPARNSRYESLDHWRGIACLMVVVFHSTNCFAATPAFVDAVRANGGTLADWALLLTTKFWIGVPIFFVISGYCIAASADASREKGRSAGDFLRRRFKRIYPPLWAYLALCVALFAILPSFAWFSSSQAGYPDTIFRRDAFTSAQWFGALTLTETWRPLVGGPSQGFFSEQLWTLCYEEQFYLIVALILLVARRWLFPLLAVVTLVVFLNVADLNAMLGARLGIDLSKYQLPADGLFLNGLWLPFAAGLTVYYRVARATPTLARCLDLFLFVMFLWALRGESGWWTFFSRPASNLLVAAAFALLLGGVHRFDAAIARSRLLAPLQWCGRMCYSLYLVHMPIALLVSSHLHAAGAIGSLQTLLVTVPISVAASVVAAAVFHRCVEKRFLNAPTVK